MIKYFIALVLSLLVCCLFGNKKRNVCAISIAFFMAILAFSMEVVDTSDLNRYYDYLDYYRGCSIQEAFSFAILKNNPFHHLIMMMFSNFSNNQMFPAIMTFVIYFLTVKLAGNVCDDNKLDRRVYVISVAFILLNLNFILVSNVIRIFFVFAVFFYCLYEESVRKNHKVICWIVYFLLVFYHYAALILIIARILGSIVNNASPNRSKIMYKAILLVSLVLGLAILFNTPLGSYVINKINGYTDYTTRGYWQTIVGWMQFAMVLCMLASNRKSKTESEGTYVSTIIMLFLVNLIMYSNYQMILRFGNAMAMCSCVPIALLYRSEPFVFNLRKCRIFEIVACMGSLIVFAYTMVFYYHVFL